MFLAKSVGGVPDATVRFQKTPMGGRILDGDGLLVAVHGSSMWHGLESYILSRL